MNCMTGIKRGVAAAVALHLLLLLLVLEYERVSYFDSGHTTAISFTLVPVKPVKMSEFNFLKA
jgi:hypothetical protein